MSPPPLLNIQQFLRPLSPPRATCAAAHGKPVPCQCYLLNGSGSEILKNCVLLQEQFRLVGVFLNSSKTKRGKKKRKERLYFRKGTKHECIGIKSDYPHKGFKLIFE